MASLDTNEIVNVSQPAQQPQQPQQPQQFVLPYLESSHDHGLDCLSEMIIDNINHGLCTDIRFDSQRDIENFQGSIHASVLCCFTRDICRGLLYPCCGVLNEPCGVCCCLVLQLPFCILSCLPWCICHTDVIDHVTPKPEPAPTPAPKPALTLAPIVISLSL